MVTIGSHSPLISDEDASSFYAKDGNIISNRITRLEANGLTEDGFVSYIADRIDWIRAGSPDTFHEYRNVNLALSA
jgi:hypothetical protein